MANDYENNQADEPAASKEEGRERPAMEDPLLELARIVQKNKQLGANVSSGRVESTDYFAGLDDFAPDAEKAAETTPGRVEPSFAATPETRENREPPAFHPDVSSAPIIGEIRNQFFARRDDDSSPDRPRVEDSRFTPPPVTPAENVSPLWPRLNNPQPSEPVADEPEAENSVVEPQFVHKVTRAEPVAVPVPAAEETPIQESTNSNSVLTPKVALDLEQNLSAELEDELIGALRNSVDEDIAQEPLEAELTAAKGAAVSSEAFDEITEFEAPEEFPDAHERVQPVAHAPAYSPSRSDSYVRTPAELLEQVRQSAPAPASGTSGFERTIEPPQNDPILPVRQEHVAAATLTAAREPKRPTIDESDFFAALNPDPVSSAPQEPAQVAAEKDSPAGIDALFADLDFPERENRKPVTVEPAAVERAVPDEDLDATADDIDDMAWPDAASAVPEVEEEETLPPPEGYDLDAVARAMQESDPSLSGAGVLPPHPAAEIEATPLAKEKSRRGLYVALGIIGVAALGGAAFFLVDGDAVQVPSGPPPVIAGLQEPLKVYPEQSQPQTKIPDRVHSTTETVPERLDVQESPQPVELPPAPATGDGAELAPGAPKQVRTVIVRPDGTIVSAEEAATTAPTQPIEPAPAISAPQADDTTTPAVSVDTSRIVATEPVIADPAPVEAVPEPVTAPQVQDEPSVVAAAEPAAPEAPAIVADTPQPAVAEPAVTEPAAPVPTVLPRKKPAPPVRVASAPAAQATPASTAQADGPLNLNNAASAAAPAAATPAGTTTGGSIPSGTYIVQVTSQRSASAASDAYAGLQRRYPGVLGDRNAVIVTADLGDRGIYYRARIPTGSREEANSLCERLTAAGGECFVRRQP